MLSAISGEASGSRISTIQPALGPIGGADRCPMQTDGAFGDGQAQPHSAGLAAAGIINAVEGTKQFVQRFLRHPGPGVGDVALRLGPLVPSSVTEPI